MTRVRILPVLFVASALVIGVMTLHASGPVGTFQRPNQGMATSPAHAPGVAAPAATSVDGGAAAAGQARGAAQRRPAPVPELVRPRPTAGLHMMFPRTWRPVTVEVGSPVARPPMRVFCATCAPGTVLEVDL